MNNPLGDMSHVSCVYESCLFVVCCYSTSKRVMSPVSMSHVWFLGVATWLPGQFCPLRHEQSSRRCVVCQHTLAFPRGPTHEHTHTRTHTRTHARTHAHTPWRTRAMAGSVSKSAP